MIELAAVLAAFGSGACLGWLAHGRRHAAVAALAGAILRAHLGARRER